MRRDETPWWRLLLPVVFGVAAVWAILIALTISSDIHVLYP